MKTILRISLIIIALIILLIFGQLSYVLITHRKLDSIVIESSNVTFANDIVVIKIDNDHRVFIDNKQSNVDRLLNDIENACRQYNNDSVLIIKAEYNTPLN